MFALSENFRFVGNPDGRGVAFGVGGLLGIVFALLVLLLRSRVNRGPGAARESGKD